MLRRTMLVVGCALTLGACTSVKVMGFVTDEYTGEPVGTCTIAYGTFSGNCDAAGHYAIKGRTKWKQMDVVAPGYVSKKVPVNTSATRYPRINVQMTPTRTPRSSVSPPPTTQPSE